MRFIPDTGFFLKMRTLLLPVKMQALFSSDRAPDVIKTLGSKTGARRLAQEAGVPVVPTPAENEFPKLIKASLGGGGRGMRIVRNATEFKDAFAAARGEAERAFR